MPSAPPSRSITPELPLKFVGGDPSLDFINTVDWTPSGLEHDRLGGYDRLVTWARSAGVVSEAEAHALRQAAASHPERAKTAYEAARFTRWALHEVFYAAATRQAQLLGQSLPEFNRLLSRALHHLEMSVAPQGTRRAGAVLKWEWRGISDQLEGVLWPVVRAAASLLTSSDAGRLRMCAGPDCGWLYVDRSRNGLRRWCEMRTCGTLSKSRKRAARRHLARSRKRV
jgi:predicted RNA-binding Zn ribbon-like protein